MRYPVTCQLIYAGCYRASCLAGFVRVFARSTACFNSRFHDETYTATT